MGDLPTINIESLEHQGSMELVLWWVDKRKKQRTFLVPGDEEFFIGRLESYMINDARLTPYDICIFNKERVYENCDISSLNLAVSRLHAKLLRQGSKLYLCDHGVTGQGSTNGTYLNGKKLQKGKMVMLNLGDSFSLATSDITFRVAVRKNNTVIVQLKTGDILPTYVSDSIGLASENYIVDPGEEVMVHQKGFTKYIMIKEHDARKILTKLSLHILTSINYLKDYQITHEMVRLEDAANMIIMLEINPYHKCLSDLNDEKILELVDCSVKLAQEQLNGYLLSENKIQALIQFLQQINARLSAYID